MAISAWSSTPASNNAAPPNGWPELMRPSDVNNSARQMMADIRSQCENTEWFDWGDTPTRLSATTFRVTGDLTSRYTVNRRIKCTDSSTLYGVITASTYGAPNTTVTVVLDSGSLSASLTAVALSIISPSNLSIPSTIGRKGADIASASTVDLSVATGDFVDITGTVSITALGTISAGVMRTVRFTGALTLTHNATSLILPGSANIATANGDTAIFRSLGSGNWKCISYQKQDGAAITPTTAPFIDSTAIIKGSADATKLLRIEADGITTATTRVWTAPDQDIDLTPATQAQMETATATDRFVPPGRVQYHPGVAKAWINFNGRGTIAINASHNVTSITDNGTGDYTITLTTAFSSANYSITGACKRISTDGGSDVIFCIERSVAIGASSFRVRGLDAGAGAIDPEVISAACFGDQ